jgi:hypothetical protein
MMATRKERIKAMEEKLRKLKAEERESERKRRAAAERAARRERQRFAMELLGWAEQRTLGEGADAVSIADFARREMARAKTAASADASETHMGEGASLETAVSASVVACDSDAPGEANAGGGNPDEC